MKIAQPGIDLIKHFEGLVLTAYQDIAGIWTIGAGHTGAYPAWLRFPHLRADDHVGPGQSISEEDAERLLREDLASREAALNGWMVMSGVDLNQNEFDALISFIFNVGFAAFKGSTAARWLREGKPREQVAAALTWWNKATVGGVLREVTGLTRRRNAESGLFLCDVAPEDFGIEHPNSFILPLMATGTDHRESNACAAKECRPLAAYFLSFVQRCFP